jgi:P27 family predicted phage terminase small subunit
MRGRKPKPSLHKYLAGNPGHRPLNDREPVPPSDLPECPEHLQGAARAEWFRVSGALNMMDLLTSADHALLEAYCVTYARWLDAEEMMKKYGIIVKSPNKGFPMTSPYLHVANSSLEQLRKLAVEFGLSPSSRSRIRVGDERAGSDLDDFLSRGQRSA